MMTYRDQGFTHLNHGDCVGADALAHDIALEIGLSVMVYPPIQKKYRAYCTGPRVIIHPEASYRYRNTSLVNSGHVLLALPNKNSESMRSGTWMTVRMARKTGLKIVVCYPDGRVE